MSRNTEFQASETVDNFIASSPHLVALLDRQLDYVAVSKSWSSKILAGSNETCWTAQAVFLTLGIDAKAVGPSVLSGDVVSGRNCSAGLQWKGIERVNWSMRPFYSGAHISGIIVELEDITEQALSLQRYSQREGELKAAQSISHTGSFRYNADKSTLIWTEETYRIFGLPLNAPLDFDVFRQTVHPDDVDTVVTRCAAALEGNPLDMEYRIIVNGEVRWVHSRAEKDPYALGILGAVQDITDRKEAELRLSEKRETLELAAEASSIGFWSERYPLGSVWWSDSLFHILGYRVSSDPTPELWLDRVFKDDINIRNLAIRKSHEDGKDYQVQYRIQRPDGEVRWIESRGRVVLDEKRQPSRAYGVIIDITRQKVSEDQNNILMAEVNHRAKNLLAVVQSIARQTLSALPNSDHFRSYIARLSGLSATHDLLVENKWVGIGFRSFLNRHLQHLHPGQVVFSGPDISICSSAAQTLGMALHELATNSAKYGALSIRAGRVFLTWKLQPGSDGSTFEIEWREEGGPAVTAPVAHGFGQKVLGEFVEFSLDGKVSLDYCPAGVRWCLAAPARLVLETGSLTRAEGG